MGRDEGEGAGYGGSGPRLAAAAAAAAAGGAAKRRNGASAHMCVSQSGDAGGGHVQACSAGAGQGVERGQAGPGEAGPCPRPEAGCGDRLDTGDGRNSRRQRPSEAVEGSRAPRPRRRAAQGGMGCVHHGAAAHAPREAQRPALRPHRAAAARSASRECWGLHGWMAG